MLGRDLFCFSLVNFLVTALVPPHNGREIVQKMRAWGMGGKHEGRVATKGCCAIAFMKYCRKPHSRCAMASFPPVSKTPPPAKGVNSAPVPVLQQMFQ